ncbi:hypothetical protein Tco_1260481, partial [Tanacetum coccineum]
MVYQLTKFHVQRVDMVINPPWNLPFLGAKGLTSPEQTATGKGISNPLMAVMVCQKPYGIQLTNVSSTETLKNSCCKDTRRRLEVLQIKNNLKNSIYNILSSAKLKVLKFLLAEVGRSSASRSRDSTETSEKIIQEITDREVNTVEAKAVYPLVKVDGTPKRGPEFT